MKCGIAQFLGGMHRDRRRFGRRGRLRRGRILVAALLPAALAAGALVPASASAFSHGFHVYNLSQYPIKLNHITGGPFEGTTPIGSVLQPGAGYQDFEVTWVFGQDTQAGADYGFVGSPGEAHNLFQAIMEVNDGNEALSQCFVLGNFSCSPRGGPPRGWSAGSTITVSDPPGTVIDIPAGQGQRQAAVLQQLCNEDNAATCKFTATKTEKVLSPEHVPTHGYGLKNPTNLTQHYTYGAADSVGSTDSVEAGVTIGVKIAKIVSVEIEAKYGHEWTQEHTFKEDVDVHCEAHHACWIVAQDPLLRTTGDFTMTLGNTTWHLRGIHVDSPDPTGLGFFTIKDCALGTADCPPDGTVPSGKSNGRVLSGKYAPSRKLKKSAIVRPRLRLSISGPSSVTAGARASYRITLSRTAPADRFVYALRTVRVLSTAARHQPHRWLLSGLGKNGSRTLKLKAAVPRGAHGSFCVAASAAAEHARGARARYCIPVAGQVAVLG